jgi:hypothetical protein
MFFQIVKYIASPCIMECYWHTRSSMSLNLNVELKDKYHCVAFEWEQQKSQKKRKLQSMPSHHAPCWNWKNYVW